MRAEGDIDAFDNENDNKEAENAITIKKSANSDDSSSKTSEEIADVQSSDLGEYGQPKYHQVNPDAVAEEKKQKERDFRKKLNQEARRSVSDSCHRGIKLVVHRPEYTSEHQREYEQLAEALMPVIREIVRKTMPLLEHEVSNEFAKNHYYGNKFNADSIAYQDFRYFARKLPPNESPSLVVGLRVDESASMTAFGRLEAAKQAVVAVNEFCRRCDIPVLIYGDTADSSKLEQMSVFAYTDFDKGDPEDKFRLMTISGKSNNRDGMALRILAERLLTAPQQTKLIISISDGQPKAMPDYTGRFAIEDMKQTLSEYGRKGITFLAAAIGQDKEVISQIYGRERFLDITNLKELPAKLVRIIARYL